MGILDRFFPRTTKGQSEGPVNYTMEGALPTGWDTGWWQQNKNPLSAAGLNSTVEACVSALSQTTAMCPLHHIKDTNTNKQKRRRNSNMERVMWRPNAYQTRTSFIVDLIRSVYFEGNAYGVAVRDDRNAVSEIHLMSPRSTRAYTDPETGDIYYYATPEYNQPFSGFNSEIDRIFPNRDVMHVRLFTERDKLRGVTPIHAAASSIMANNAIAAHQGNFFTNMSRPSGVLSTELPLGLEQIRELRKAWDEQSSGINSGRLPILSNGLKFETMSLSSEDSQLAESFGLTVADISRIFRVPLVLINDMTGSTYSNAEQTMNFFLSSGLGFLMEHLELEIARFFGIPFREKAEFDTSVLMRVDYKTRVDATGDAVTKGILAPNEGRAEFGKPAKKGGGEPRVQQQMVPLSQFERQMSLEEARFEEEKKRNEEADSQPEPEPVGEEEPATEDPPADDDSEGEKFYDILHSEYRKALVNE